MDVVIRIDIHVVGVDSAVEGLLRIGNYPGIEARKRPERFGCGKVEGQKDSGVPVEPAIRGNVVVHVQTSQGSCHEQGAASTDAPANKALALNAAWRPG
jgi:hypothetical protein